MWTDKCVHFVGMVIYAEGYIYVGTSMDLPRMIIDAGYMYIHSTLFF